MALILNLETATTVCSVALAKDGNLVSFKEIDGDYSHAENLTEFINDVFNQSEYELNEVDAIAVSMGPGSYTGLRIGVSVAKGICYSLDKPLIAINTLSHISYSVSAGLRNNKPNLRDSNILFCPMLDARRMEVYCALFDIENNCIMPTAAIIIDELSFEKQLEKNLIYFFGNGAPKCKQFLSNNPNAIFINDICASAKHMIPLTQDAYHKSRFVDLADFEPFYLKDFVAGKKKKENNLSKE